jgi:hypothetical protein
MTSEEDAKQPLPLAYRITLLWLGYTLWATLAGWGLSLLGHVDGSGYIRCMPILVLLCCCLWRKTGPWVPVLPNKPRVLRKPAALAWLVIAVLAGVAGALHAPANYDALSYRLPRILNWWQEGHWYWIGAVNAGCSFSTGCHFCCFHRWPTEHSPVSGCAANLPPHGCGSFPVPMGWRYSAAVLATTDWVPYW